MAATKSRYELKTKKTAASVAKFIAAQPKAETRADCEALVEIMETITKEPAAMWGPSIVGFGKYHYTYASGHEGDMCLTGFSPRKQALTIYVLADFPRCAELLAKLGTYTNGKSCLYVKRLSDVHLPTLKTLIRESVKYTKNKTWP